MSSHILLLLTSISLGLLLFALTASWSHNIVFGQAVMLPSVKITYPSAEENIGAINTLIFRGVSSDNSSSDCQVSIILNDIRPYQPVVPIKDNDYSSWTFTLGASYTTVKDGYNKATAKISCLGTPVNATKWNSVNFTRIIENDITNITSNNQSVESSQEKLEDTALNASTIENNTQIESLNKTSEIIDNASSLVTPSVSPTTLKPLSIAVSLDKNPIPVGSLQTAKVNVSDSVTDGAIANATVEAGIISPSGKSIRFENMTTATGETSFSWIVARVAETGLVDINFNVSATGYVPNQTSASYEVVKDPSLTNQTLSPFN